MSPPFAVLLDAHMTRTRYTAGQLHELTAIPKSNIERWRVRGRPRDLQDVLKLAAALRCSAAEADALLRAARKPGLNALRATLAPEDTLLADLLVPWGRATYALQPPPPVPSSDVPFVGRALELAHVQSALSARRSVCIMGLAGIGKSALAARARAMLAPQFKHGAVRVRVGAHWQAHQVCAALARALGVLRAWYVSATTLPAALDELALYLHEADVLCELDNVETAGQVEPLLVGLPGVTWLITARRALTLPQALACETLDALAPDEAAQALLAHARLRSARHRADAVRVATRLGGLPVALEVAAGLLRVGRVADCAELALWLEQAGVTALALDNEKSVRAFFARALAESAPEAVALFALCGIFPHPRMTRQALVEIAQASGLASSALGRLAEAHFVTWAEARAALVLHPLVHECAVEHARTHAQVDAWQVAFAVHHARLAEGLRFTDREKEKRDRDVLERELDNLLAAFEYAHNAEAWALLLRFWSPLTAYLWIMGMWERYRQVDTYCLEAARALGRTEQAAKIMSELGFAALELSEFDEAERCFRASLAVYTELGAPEGLVRTWRYLGILQIALGEHEAALQALQTAWDLIEQACAGAATEPEWSALARGLIRTRQADCALWGGDYVQARGLAEAGLRFCQQAGYKQYEASALLRLGDIACRQGDLDEAAEVWGALSAFARPLTTELRVVAATHLRLAQVAALAGDLARAKQLMRHAEHLFVSSGRGEKATRAAALAARIAQGALRTVADIELWD